MAHTSVSQLLLCGTVAMAVVGRSSHPPRDHLRRSAAGETQGPRNTYGGFHGHPCPGWEFPGHSTLEILGIT